MNYLSVENISKSYGERVLFEKVSFGINKDQKIAFVAKNGTGKTSILNQLEGLGKIDGWLAVYFSLQGVQGSDDSYGVPTERVFQGMAESIAKALFNNGLEAILPDGSLATRKLGIARACREGISREDPFSDFSEYLNEVLEILKEKDLRLVLMMDEFDKLQEGIDAKVTSPQVPENIRYLVQSTGRFSALSSASMSGSSEAPISSPDATNSACNPVKTAPPTKSQYNDIALIASSFPGIGN